MTNTQTPVSLTKSFKLNKRGKTGKESLNCPTSHCSGGRKIAVIPAFSGVGGPKNPTENVLCSEQGSGQVLAPHTVPCLIARAGD